MARRLHALLALAFAACAPEEDDLLAPPLLLDTPVDTDRDGTPDADDCDPDDPGIHPGVAEACNGLDDNCDGVADEGAMTVWYVDADTDGYAGTPVEGCELPLGASPSDDDCDDADPDVSPGAPEICDDGVDNDCDGAQPQCRREGDIEAASAPTILRGEERERLGSSVARAGDVDGDGVPDLWVGAYADGRSTDNYAGSVFLVPGGTTGDQPAGSVAIATLYGDETNAKAGWSIAGGDDLDGDGVPDVALGAPGEGSSGAVFVVSGTVRGSMTLGAGGVITEGHESQDGIGTVVSTSPDLTGDGVGDVIIGSEGTGEAPAAWILAGPLPGTYTLDEAWVIGGDARAELAGGGVAGLGDVNGDGAADLVVAADGSRLGGTDGGAAAVFYGPVTWDATIGEGDRVIVAEADGDELGRACVGGRGDVDGDGLDDLLVCAPSNSTGERNAGAVYLFSGSATASGMQGAWDATARIYGDVPDGYLAMGHDLGDLDGDSRAEVLVGSPWIDASGINAGVALVFYGPVTGTLASSDADARFAAAPGEGLGSGVAAVGDGDGDGFGDLLLGAWGSYGETSGEGAGAAYLFR